LVGAVEHRGLGIVGHGFRGRNLAHPRGWICHVSYSWASLFIHAAHHGGERFMRASAGAVSLAPSGVSTSFMCPQPG
jgi:hypothetical protein